MTTADSKRPSSRTMMPRPQSSENWCCGWHRCCGVCVAPLQSRPICFGFRPRFCAIADIDARRQTNRNNGRTCSIASSTRRFHPACAPETPSAVSAITLTARPHIQLTRNDSSHAASSGSPISTTACSSGSGGMNPRCGAKCCRRSLRCNRPDVAERQNSASPPARSIEAVHSLSNANLKLDLCALQAYI